MRALFARGRLPPEPGRPWSVAGQRRADLHATGACGLHRQARLHRNKKDPPPSTALRHDDPLSRHRFSYLNGGGGSGKTTRAIELFRTRNLLVFTPTDRLAKEMRARGVQASSAGAARKTGNLPRLARGSGRPGHLLRRPGTAAPNRRRNTTRLAPRACQLLQRGRGRPQSQRPPYQGPQKGYSPPTRPSTVSGYEKGASWLARVGALRGGLEAM